MRRVPFTAIVATDDVFEKDGARHRLSIAGVEWETPVPLCLEHRDVVVGEITRVNRTKRNVVVAGFIEDDDAPRTKRLLADIHAGKIRCSVGYNVLQQTYREERGVGVLYADRWDMVEASLTRTPANPHTRVYLGGSQPSASVAKRAPTHRAYSVLTIKRADEDARTIVGIASTPETDRMRDVVVPSGAEFKLPLPLLLHHDPRLPIGQVTRAKVTAAGIEVEARISRSDTPGPVKDRLDGAWQDIKLGLVRGLSIGFRPLETAPIAGGGLRFVRWDWMELSCVTIPANADANIVAIKTAAGVRSAPARPEDVSLSPHANELLGALITVLRGKASPEAVGGGMADLVRMFADPLSDRIKDLERRVEKSLRWSGPHVDGEHYVRGDLVQRAGTIWVCEGATCDTPGRSNDWRQLVRWAPHKGKGERL
jgi:HK97 family phage prohead protease